MIGSRGSKLALIQAESVADMISGIRSDLEVVIHRIATRADIKRNVQLEHMGEIGVFVKDLEEALLDSRIDVAVHSLKDVPTKIPSGLRLSAVLERLDPRDVLVTRGQGLSGFAPGSTIGTGSLRRAVQIKACRPDLEVCGIRGNVDTRLRMVADGEVDGVILAAAAMKRLDWGGRITEYLPVEQFLPAVGQGTLVIEARSDDKEVNEIVAPLNHLPTWQCVSAERAMLSALGGGCRAPIAALGTVTGTSLRLEGMVADASGEKILHGSEEGGAISPEELGVKLAQKLLAMGAAEFIAEARER